MSERRILVTGATGNVGREVLASLTRAGLPVTAAVRHPRTWGCSTPEIPAVALDFRDPRTWETALAAHDGVFLVRPPAIADVKRTLIPFIDRAYTSGIQHIVFLSVAGVDRNGFVPHAKVEAHLASRGDAYTSLRPGFFAQNLQDAYVDDILEENRIVLPAGHAPVNWIDVRDVADVAARVFAEPARHRGKGYALTGPGPVRWEHVTGLLSEVTGRTIRYDAVSIPAYVLHLRRRKRPFGAIAVQTLLHALLRFGHGAKLDPTLEELLGRPGRSIETHIRDHAHVWLRPGAWVDP